ncbi:MAG: tetratricopeptide repeat protein [Deferrisomatales bacterium]|nr:tetratricopeptide repeat protein [Deferrisomatales bacterium]
MSPVCFMVMPFGTKPVRPPVAGAPDTIDFDTLWNRAFEPLLRELGYTPVRADQEVGALIVHEMLERLYFSDLVLADMTIPNGNVYYEVGIRHACQRTGCVLVGAGWSRPLFDLDQMRRLVYPLPEGSVTEATAAGVRDALRGGLAGLAQGDSPLFQVLPGFPAAVDPNRATSIKNQLEELSAFQSRARKTRLTRDQGERRRLALELQAACGPPVPVSRPVALELAMLLRDCAGWQEAIAYIDALPAPLRDLDLVQEQRCLALSKTGDPRAAIGALEELIRRRGDSSERQGLLGGRYKMLADEARAAGDDAGCHDYLDRAIEHYEQGMRLDLNDYYPSCNLPRLYRERDEEGDTDRADTAARIALLACERSLARNPGDEWAKSTLLGMAFDRGDVAAARRLAKEVRREGAAVWKLETTLADLERSVRHLSDTARQEALGQVLSDLSGLL